MKMWYIYIMKFYSYVKKNEIILLLGNWIDYWKLLLFLFKGHRKYFVLF